MRVLTGFLRRVPRRSILYGFTASPMGAALSQYHSVLPTNLFVLIIVFVIFLRPFLLTPYYESLTFEIDDQFLVQGDAISCGLYVGDGCTTVLTTQASTKVRSPNLACTCPLVSLKCSDFFPNYEPCWVISFFNVSNLCLVLLCGRYISLWDRSALNSFWR